jgi:DNA-binding transcriptional ArsR family regulator
MEESDALAALSALANPLRLAAFRRLVVAGREGLAAGALAEALGTPPSTLSSALSLLESARLVSGERRGRSILYAARLDGLRDLLALPDRGLLRRPARPLPPRARLPRPPRSLLLRRPR